MRRPRDDMRRAPHKNLRPRRPLSAVADRHSARKMWLIVFVLLSLLGHALLVLAIVLISKHTPKEPELAKDQPPPEVSITLQPPPQPHNDFIPTQPDASARHKPAPFISDNDNALKSKNKIARAPDMPLPDMTGQKNHSLEMHSSPSSPATKNAIAPPARPTPPTPPQQPQPPTPEKPAKPAKPTPPQPEEPSSLTPTATPVKSEQKVPPSQDPNALPVLPPINAPTLAPQTPQTAQVPQVQQRRPGSPPPSFAVRQSDMSGAVGSPGDNSPEAMASDLGRYKAKVYRAVGSRWYASVDSHFDVLGTQVGTVHVTYTIYADGHMVIVADPDKNTASLEILHDISMKAMLDAAPFEPFSPEMKKEVGESYTDDFTFNVYSGSD